MTHAIPDLTIVDGFREAAEFMGRSETGVRERREADIFFPGSADWRTMRGRWYRCQLSRWLELLQVRRDHAEAAKIRVRPFEIGGYSAVGEWEGLHRTRRAGSSDHFETEDGVYAMQRLWPGPPSYSLFAAWVITCRKVPVAEGPMGFSQARAVLTELRAQDLRRGGPPSRAELRALVLSLGEQDPIEVRPSWADGVAGQVVGEGLSLAPDLTDIPNEWGVLLNSSMGEIAAVPMRVSPLPRRRDAKKLVALVPGPEALDQGFRVYLQDTCVTARRQRRHALRTIRKAVASYTGLELVD